MWPGAGPGHFSSPNYVQKRQKRQKEQIVPSNRM